MFETGHAPLKEMGVCKHGNETGCEECQKEAEAEKNIKDNFKVIEGGKGKEEKDSEALKLTREIVSDIRERGKVLELSKIMESARQFDESLDPNEYNTERINTIRELHSQIENESNLGGGQNESFVLGLRSGKEGVYKPSSGEDEKIEKWNIAKGKAFVREWLAHHVELNLELNVVPTTILRTNSHGVGSVQEFIQDSKPILLKYKDEIDKSLETVRKKGREIRKEEAERLVSQGKSEEDALDSAKEKEVMYIVMESDTVSPVWDVLENNLNKDQLVSMAINDFLIENNDRGIRNIMADNEGNVFGIDNGSSFPEKPVDWVDDNYPNYYHTQNFLFKKLGGQEIPPEVLGKLEWFNGTPERQQRMKEAMIISLGEELGGKKWREFQERLHFLLENKKVPSSMYNYK